MIGTAGRGRGGVGIWLGLGVVLASAGGSAEASRIHIHSRQAPPAPRVRPYSQQFYALALLTHRLVPVPYALRALQAEDGVLPETPFIEYLRWRRGLNPARFDRWHPFMGLMLERDRIIRAQLPPIPPFFHPPQVDALPPIYSPPPPPDVPRVPEPSTGLIGLAMIGAAAVARRRRRAQSSSPAMSGNSSATGMRKSARIAPPSSSWS